MTKLPVAVFVSLHCTFASLLHIVLSAVDLFLSAPLKHMHIYIVL